MDLRETARLEFQAFLDTLNGEHGFTYLVDFPGGGVVRSHLAGMRVLEATPLFDRKTGAVQSWRYLLLFAEMAMLDLLCSSHPVHVFECEVVSRDAGNVTFKEREVGYTIIVSRNDPHELHERQAAIYKDWDASVVRFGGVTRLQEVIDEQAAEWLRQLYVLREDPA